MLAVVTATVLVVNTVEAIEEMALNDFVKGTFEPFKSWVEEGLNDLRARVGILETAVFGRIQPLLNVVHTTVGTLSGIVATINGNVDQLVNDVYRNLFPGLDEVRRQIHQVSSDLQSVVGLFDSKLAIKISESESKLLGVIAKYTSDLRDELLDNIHGVTDRLTRTITEVESAIGRVVDGVNGRLRTVENLLGQAFESPLVLTRAAISANVGKWGTELFEGILGKASGTTRPSEFSLTQRPPEEPVTEFMALRVSRGGDWDDLDKYQNWWVLRLFGRVADGTAPVVSLQVDDERKPPELSEAQLQAQLRLPEPTALPPLRLPSLPLGFPVGVPL